MFVNTNTNTGTSKNAHTLTFGTTTGTTNNTGNAGNGGVSKLLKMKIEGGGSSFSLQHPTHAQTQGQTYTLHSIPTSLAKGSALGNSSGNGNGISYSNFNGNGTGSAFSNGSSNGSVSGSNACEGAAAGTAVGTAGAGTGTGVSGVMVSVSNKGPTVVCSCGNTVSKKHIKAHIDTAKHRHLMQLLSR
jgi:hypothetical protein